MNKRVVRYVVAGLSLCGALLMAEEMGEQQKAKVSAMLKQIKEKSKTTVPAKYEVALPVASAGARGAEMKQADRFSVIWPDSGIAPLTALAENLQFGVAKGEKVEQLRAQIEDFKKVFPEFADDKLLNDLATLISPPA